MMTFTETKKVRVRRFSIRPSFVLAFVCGALVVGIIAFGFSRSSNDVIGPETNGNTTYPGIAQGTIRDSTGNPIKYVKIKITTPQNKKIVGMTTDEDGYYERTMPNGPYQLHVFIEGKEIIQNIVVSENGTQNGDVLLTGE